MGKWARHRKQYNRVWLAENQRMLGSGGTQFYPCKRYDKDGILIEEISADDQIKAGNERSRYYDKKAIKVAVRYLRKG